MSVTSQRGHAGYRSNISRDMLGADQDISADTLDVDLTPAGTCWMSVGNHRGHAGRRTSNNRDMRGVSQGGSEDMLEVNAPAETCRGLTKRQRGYAACRSQVGRAKLGVCQDVSGYTMDAHQIPIGTCWMSAKRQRGPAGHCPRTEEVCPGMEGGCPRTEGGAGRIMRGACPTAHNVRAHQTQARICWVSIAGVRAPAGYWANMMAANASQRIPNGSRSNIMVARQTPARKGWMIAEPQTEEGAGRGKHRT